MKNVKLCSIVAMAENHVIGKDNDLLWHIPADFKHFKSTTMDKPMIMGRKTFESLPGVLKGRTHIVVTRGNFEHPEAITRRSLEDAINAAKDIAQKDNQDEVFIIGGGEIYKQTLPLINLLYLTLVHDTYEGDTHFPQFNWSDWTVNREEKHAAENNSPAFTIFTLDRKI